ncbi:MAG: glycosyltransferase family 2 protein [Terrimicrobiaceae bacterium]|nr:glycosyltransferase family 2 protein [Terrimicrobiaceae bacterium]
MSFTEQAPRKPATIGVLIPTLNAERSLSDLLSALLRSPERPKILVLDSESDDRTVEIARGLGVSVLPIQRCQYNHGATREFGRRELNTDIVVMMTQDAIPTGPDMLAELVRPLREGSASVAYARQLPRKGADLFEAFPRAFNYPQNSVIRRIEDARKYGVKTFSCSDSCAAYLNAAVDEIGGFPTILTNEDYFVVAEILRRGGRIAYVAEATVFHSHRFSAIEELRRNFDNGYVRGERREVSALVGPAEKEGASYARAFLLAVARQCPWMLPMAVLHLAAKWGGFRLGFLSPGMPDWWKRLFSSQPGYWEKRQEPALQRRAPARS